LDYGAVGLPQDAQKDTAAASGHGGRQSDIALVSARPWVIFYPRALLVESGKILVYSGITNYTL